MNNENNNLDMTNLKTKKEYYVEQLEKYEKLNDKEGKLISINVAMATVAICVCTGGIMYHNSLALTAIGGIFGSISLLSFSIAKKAGLESRINAIKEQLELYKLLNNRSCEEIQDDENYLEEKGRNL